MKSPAVIGFPRNTISSLFFALEHTKFYTNEGRINRNPVLAAAAKSFVTRDAKNRTTATVILLKLKTLLDKTSKQN